MKPNGGGEPTGDLRAIQQAFGSFDAFKAALTMLAQALRLRLGMACARLEWKAQVISTANRIAAHGWFVSGDGQRCLGACLLSDTEPP
jgi:hypothetical protein